MAPELSETDLFNGLISAVGNARRLRPAGLENRHSLPANTVAVCFAQFGLKRGLPKRAKRIQVHHVPIY
ncbi:MAG: hypothetical protein K8R46_00035, partial [Pirellulales bacterium]|nr:hypothetical protein [Pirellulales bacterium]